MRMARSAGMLSPLGGLVCAWRDLPLKRARPDTATGRAHAMPKTPDELFAFLESLGIEVTTVTHPPLFTVADSQALRGEIAGRTHQEPVPQGQEGQLFPGHRRRGGRRSTSSRSITLIGAASRVSFGKPEALMELLGVTPGAVTAFGLINDADGAREVRARRGADGARRSSTRIR